MRISILTDQKIDTLTMPQNQKIVAKYINDNSDNSWLKDFFREEEPFTLSKVEMDDITFDMSAEVPAETDFENAKKLFEALKHISESTACDERLWLSLTFGKFYDYMNYRYNIAETPTMLQNKWFMQKKSKKSGLFRQGISMLWWYAYISYDDTLSNPYELTEFCFKHKDFLISIYSRSFSGSKTVRLALIQALRDFEQDGGSIEKKEVYNGIVKYVSFLGGAYLVDTFTREELYDKIFEELIRIEDELNKSIPNRFKLN
jgi:hypothetical protein